MLDSTTKKNIDDCRDVLVGKVPDPKSQIEQITLALIYKFMDDMDREAVEKFKGKAKFFVTPPKTNVKEIDDKLKGFEKYGWRKLFAPALNGQQVLELYSEALERLSINPNIPELFRNIFKNAYLPYRDPSTLKLFLKHINAFEYSHSEKLGDAFEYLLSVMGSQGDAGQFRTPRHIIDFVTACVNPQKNETVLDPACGTAGFLLSAYKHILEQNKDKRSGDKLKPEDRKKLANNFVGYDISPDMVRLSLANMYLHGFTTPKILEYDSLTSEDRWAETYDVILANPPFMTPKGGIRPHKKFGVQANKAEVLFTDYIAEHLTKNGRAGIVVPNGIVATSQTAYNQLRKHLVEDSLIAVISLPSGVFQPYSGVKTSILVLDKQLSKKSKDVLFLKIVNDGFDLGAQRREIDKNDLPLALKALEKYKECLAQGTLTENLPSLATLINKKIILANKDILLSSDRYLTNKDFNTEYKKVKLGDVLDYEQPTKYIVESENYDDRYKTPVLTAGKSFVLGHTNETKGVYSDNLPVIIFDDFTTATKFVDFPFKVKSSAMKILKVKQELAEIKYLYYMMQQIVINSSEHKRYWISQYSQIEIPLPSLEIQQQIVNEIETYQKIIDGAKQIVNNYKPTISINSDWNSIELENICDVRDGTHDSPKYVLKGGIPFITQKNITKQGLSFEDVNYISEEDHKKIIKRSNVEYGDIIISMIGANRGMSCIIDDKRIFSIKNVGLIKSLGKVNQSYLLYYLKSTKAQDYISLMSSGGAQQFIGLTSLRKFPIPLPSIQEQQDIVKAIEEEMQLVENNKKLIQLFEAKIKNKIAEVWGVKKEAEEPQEELMVAAEPAVGYKSRKLVKQQQN